MRAALLTNLSKEFPMVCDPKQLRLPLHVRARWLLPLPATLPDGAFVYQRINIVEDAAHDGNIHVELGEGLECAERWGMYLADAARAMVRDYASRLYTDRKDGDLFEAIRNGFNNDNGYVTF